MSPRTKAVLVRVGLVIFYVPSMILAVGAELSALCAKITDVPYLIWEQWQREHERAVDIWRRPEQVGR